MFCPVTLTRIEALLTRGKGVVDERNSVFFAITHDIRPQIASLHLLNLAQILDDIKKGNAIADPTKKRNIEKSGKYCGPRRNGWAGAVSGGQEQYQVGRGSIGWAGAVSAVPLPKSDFQHIKKVF